MRCRRVLSKRRLCSSHVLLYWRWPLDTCALHPLFFLGPVSTPSFGVLLCWPNPAVRCGERSNQRWAWAWGSRRGRELCFCSCLEIICRSYSGGQSGVCLSVCLTVYVGMTHVKMVGGKTTTFGTMGQDGGPGRAHRVNAINGRQSSKHQQCLMRHSFSQNNSKLLPHHSDDPSLRNWAEVAALQGYRTLHNFTLFCT